MKILLCFGTRPEWLKIKPLTRVLDNYELLFTGQHTDLLKYIEADYKINIKIKLINQIFDAFYHSCLCEFTDNKPIWLWEKNNANKYRKNKIKLGF